MPLFSVRSLLGRLILVATAAVSTAAVSVSAQNAPVSPPTREEIQRPVEPSKERDSRLEMEGGIERSPCPLADPEFADITIELASVTFNNLEGATDAEMAAAYSGYLGHEQPVAVICEIRDSAATILRDKGYLAAVQVPTQRIEEGNVVFEVLYARVTAIRVRGQTGNSEELIGGYLNHLQNDPIFNRKTAERYLLLARDLPGYDVRLSLRPAGTGPGELIGEVTVLRTPVEVDFNIQNLAGKDTGRWGGQLRAQFNDITGLGDTTSMAYFATSDFEEQHILQGSHEFRIGDDGFSTGINITQAWTRPALGDVPAGTPPIKAETFFATLYGSYPIIRSQAENLSIAGGLDFIDQNVDFGVPIVRDRATVVFIRSSFDLLDTAYGNAPQWRVSGSFEWRRGLDIFAAVAGCGGNCLGRIPTSRADGDPTASVFRASMQLESALSPDYALVSRPRVQYAFDPLLSFEEFSTGNYTVGRGYDPGTIIGDDGIGVQTELRYGPTRFGAQNISLQPYVFFDWAMVWNKDIPAVTDPQKLASFGTGLRASLSNRFRLDAALAFPARTIGTQGDGDVRFLLTLTTRLFPWSN